MRRRLLPRDVDRAAHVAVETRVEEAGRILQRRALGERQLDDALIRFTGADDAIVRPHRGAGVRWLHPFPLFDDVRVGLLDEAAHSAKSLAAPVAEVGDPFRNELRRRQALARTRLFHVLILSKELFNQSGCQLWVARHTPGRADFSEVVAMTARDDEQAR